jgi:hypothetical protein
MRCRLPVGHDGECFDHEERAEFDSMIVSTRGEMIAAALADEPPPETRRAKALQKLAALPAFDATVLMVPLDDEPPKEET